MFSTWTVDGAVNVILNVLMFLYIVFRVERMHVKLDDAASWWQIAKGYFVSGRNANQDGKRTLNDIKITAADINRKANEVHEAAAEAKSHAETVLKKTEEVKEQVAEVKEEVKHVPDNVVSRLDGGTSAIFK